jgi:hypothetical protein
VDEYLFLASVSASCCRFWQCRQRITNSTSLFKPKRHRALLSEQKSGHQGTLFEWKAKIKTNVTKNYVCSKTSWMSTSFLLLSQPLVTDFDTADWELLILQVFLSGKSTRHCCLSKSLDTKVLYLNKKLR